MGSFFFGTGAMGADIRAACLRASNTVKTPVGGSAASLPEPACDALIAPHAATRRFRNFIRSR
jgi:hypothetical protein